MIVDRTAFDRLLQSLTVFGGEPSPTADPVHNEAAHDPARGPMIDLTRRAAALQAQVDRELWLAGRRKALHDVRGHLPAELAEKADALLEAVAAGDDARAVELAAELSAEAG
jgi:hypothetical protein